MTGKIYFEFSALLVFFPFRVSMVQEPLLLIVAFFLFFFLTIIYVRLDFAITKDEGSEARMKVAGVCEKILGHQERRNASYSAFDDALARLKSSKDASAFAAASKKVASDHKAETQSIADLAAGLKPLSPEVADKVGEVQKFDRYGINPVFFFGSAFAHRCSFQHLFNIFHFQNPPRAPGGPVPAG